MLSGLGQIVRDEGVAGLYKGLKPALLREGSYSALRMGLYEPIKELLGATDPANTPLYLKIIAGGSAGAIGGAIANPADLIKVRMQGDLATPGQAPRYPGLFAAFRMIATTEGVVNGLYRGVGPTASRGMLLTAAQLPAYDHIKHTMLNLGVLPEGKPLHFISSFAAGFIAVGVTNPGALLPPPRRLSITHCDVNMSGAMHQASPDVHKSHCLPLVCQLLEPK